MKLIFLKPQNLKFILRIFAENFFNKILKREEISGEVKKYVFENAIRNNPSNVLIRDNATYDCPYSNIFFPISTKA